MQNNINFINSINFIYLFFRIMGRTRREHILRSYHGRRRISTRDRGRRRLSEYSAICMNIDGLTESKMNELKDICLREMLVTY